MRFPLSYLAGPLTALLIVAAFYAGGYWLLALPAIVYLALPVAEQIAGVSRWPSQTRLDRMSGRAAARYEFMLLLGAWSYPLLLGWALWAVAVTPLAWWQFGVLALLLGEYGGFVGIVTAHELMHRSGGKRQLSFFLMALTGYAHFCVEHVRGHHVRVATPEDPATARRGESLYGFVIRSVIGGFRSAWRLEAERLERAGKAVWSHHNDILRWHGFTLALAIAVILLLGPASLLLFAIQAFFAIMALEAINYLEHYGLLRSQRPDGSYERVRPAHSWNSSHIVSNVSLFNLGRHSDHHAQSNRPYYRLRHHDAAPQLPFGYGGSFVLSLVPPLWFRVMDRELDRFEARAGAEG
ncbi:MAG: alkane 1-monooxygenase [Sphingomonadaceae bacterium]|nr:alkane 1-monooxygenase [Sphingomonadaceae bacterium]